MKYFLLCLGISSCAYGLQFNHKLTTYQPLTSQKLANILEQFYHLNPKVREQLFQLTDEQIEAYLDKLTRALEEAFLSKAPSGSFSRSEHHKTQLRNLIRAHRDEAKAKWLVTQSKIIPTVQWNEIAPPDRSLELLKSEAEQRYPLHQENYQKWKEDLNKLQEGDSNKKKEFQVILSQALEEEQQHRRYLLEHFLGHWPVSQEKEILSKAALLSQTEKISVEQLKHLLETLKLIVAYNQRLVQHILELVNPEEVSSLKNPSEIKKKF